MAIQIMTFPNMVISKKNDYIFVFKSKEANVMRYTHRHTIQAHVCQIP